MKCVVINARSDWIVRPLLIFRDAIKDEESKAYFDRYIAGDR